MLGPLLEQKLNEICDVTEGSVANLRAGIRRSIA